MARRNPIRLTRTQQFYQRQLEQVARAIASIIHSTTTDGNPESARASIPLLEAYARQIDEWAQQTAKKMISMAWASDQSMWLKMSKEVGQNLYREIKSAPTGAIHQQLMSEQVTLIKSLPLEAAERVHELVGESLVAGRRVVEIVEEIKNSGEVSLSRARTIARTETARASATLMQARAEHIGSPGYFWRTVGDSKVRHDHEELDGKFFTWSNPPIADRRSGARAHPGCIYNCRCYADPVLPKEEE